MKIMDLLNLVYEKKAPKKILYKYCEYEFNTTSNDYENKDGLELFSYLFQNEEQALFLEVEIIEEKPKYIENWTKFAIERINVEVENIESLKEYLITTINTQKEIIDGLNYLLKKEEE